jgi:hypothetical protein
MQRKFLEVVLVAWNPLMLSQALLDQHRYTLSSEL